MNNSFRSTLVIGWLIACLGCAQKERVGVLTKDVKAGIFGKPGYLITLPKGTTVREVMPPEFGAFEPYRFQVTLTTADSDLIDYSVAPTNPNQELYSIDSVRWLSENGKKQK